MGRIRDFVTANSGYVRTPFYLAIVAYIAAIGIFAIEELNARTDALALVSERIQRATDELARVETAANDVKGDRGHLLDARESLLRGQRRIQRLILTGARDPEGGTHWTLGTILCSLEVKVPEGDCDKGAQSTATRWDRVFLVGQGEISASGNLFGLLVVTAALSGALIGTTLSKAKPGVVKHETFATVLRGVGAGIICYLAVNGDVLPGPDLSSYTTPAGASLLGLLSGMFSLEVFEMVRELVNDFLDRLKGKSEKTDEVAR